MYQKEMNACIENALRIAGEKKKCSSIWFENYRKRHGLNSLQALDREIFIRMYQREPKENEIQRVRFWRLSRHLPKSRKEAVRLGQALELSGEALDCFFGRACYTAVYTGKKTGSGDGRAVFAVSLPDCSGAS